MNSERQTRTWPQGYLLRLLHLHVLVPFGIFAFVQNFFATNGTNVNMYAPLFRAYRICGVSGGGVDAPWRCYISPLSNYPELQTRLNSNTLVEI